MKIRAKVVESSKEYDELKEKFTKKHPESRKQLERMGDLKKAYIELDTGGEFDDMPKEIQEALKKSFEIYLSEFGRLLLAAYNFDFAIKFQGMDIFPGNQAIQAGLEEMGKQLETAAMI